LNQNAIHTLEQNLDKVVWHYLSENPNAIRILHLFSFTPFLIYTF